MEQTLQFKFNWHCNIGLMCLNLVFKVHLKYIIATIGWEEFVTYEKQGWRFGDFPVLVTDVKVSRPDGDLFSTGVDVQKFDWVLQRCWEFTLTKTVYH